MEQTGQFEKQINYKMISYPSSKTLPPEIVSLVLEEFDYDIWPLRKCSLVCKSWRNLSLPFLFHHLCLSDGKTFLRAFRLLVVDAPHIGQFVREILIGKSIAAQSSELLFLANTTDKERLEALFLALPGLKVLHCGFGGHLTIPLTLLRSSITTLYLDGTIEPINELMILLQAGAETIRFLTIQNVVYRGLSSDQLLSRNMPFPGCMLALEELSIIWCDELPFLPSTIQMPNLRTLKLDNCDGSILSCVPASLDTLAFQIEPDMSLPANKLLTVENVVVFCDTVDIDDQLSEHMIGKLCVTSVIKRLELLLLFFDCGDDIPHDFAFMIDKDFEDDMLRLHRHGSLERVIVTSKFCPEMVHAMFPKLSNLCILDVRTSDVSPVLAPQRRRFINTRNGLWSWSSSW
ncbi:hypothetical protein PC9H_005705 [Pleurotus ostreatus]|uniref:F-box domain-containing protein n=1 Tax=Pleurotus ostreatus TaxID=5322 RepID=A0A8H6ZWZ0_PLEOS|nr:uncharacterized protein PC9H_005705 [Pleurotus ostreatus]KAF7433740.1 hypothetical protein PC9H_005705 [Pleurotus ostreatus]KAJ8697480.1 hypothetical protein PTI98_004283 [Pleurotus ostreatus]